MNFAKKKYKESLCPRNEGQSPQHTLSSSRPRLKRSLDRQEQSKFRENRRKTDAKQTEKDGQSSLFYHHNQTKFPITYHPQRARLTRLP